MEKQFVAFKVGTTFYCIDIMDVQEVIRESHITHMPNFPDFLEGVINLRGTITPLLSIDKRLAKSIAITNNSNIESQKTIQHLHAINSGYPLKLIIINVDSISLGLLVDTLDKILTVDDQQIQQTEGFGVANNHKMVAGILQVDGEIYTVLDPKFILENNETQQLAESLNQ